MALETKNRGVISAEEVSAMKSKYDEPLNRDDYLKYVIQPGLFTALYGILCTYYWWVGIIMFALGAWYGYRHILPDVVEQDYYINSLTERNTFIVNMTQILTDKNKVLSSALQMASSRAHGELRKDLSTLQAGVLAGTPEQIHQSFEDLRYKYVEDISFAQYLEQLETIANEGTNNLETLKELKTQHSEMLKKQMAFQEKKDVHWKGVKRMVMLGIAGLVALEVAFGFKMAFHAFCRAPAGWGTSFVYVSMVLISLTSFRKAYFDNDIMSLKGKVKNNQKG